LFLLLLLLLLLLLSRLISPHGLVIKHGAASSHDQYGCEVPKF
jgi:hypothetical protein